MSFFSEKTKVVNVDELESVDIQLDMNMLNNLTREEQWDVSNMGFIDYSYLAEKVSKKYHAVNIVIEDRVSRPGKTIFSLGYRFDTNQDKLAFILKFS